MENKVIATPKCHNALGNGDKTLYSHNFDGSEHLASYFGPWERDPASHCIGNASLCQECILVLYPIPSH